MKQVLFTKNAPAAVGPYSQAIDVGDFVFLSGQIPIDPATGNIVEGGVAAQTRQIFSNISAVLESAGLTLQDVIKTMVYVTDLGEFATLNSIYGEYFPENPPARSCVEVSALPKGAQVEIEVIAKR